MRKKVILATIIALIFIISSSYVNALGFKFTATPNKTTVEPGGEIEVTLDISNIDLGENGMNTIEGILQYDHSIFEEIKSSNITALNGWGITYNDEKNDLNGKFLGILFSDGVKNDQSIAKIKFKVKSDIEDQNTKIVIKKIATNDGTNPVEEVDKTVNIKIQKATSGGNSGSGSTGSGNTVSNSANGSTQTKKQPKRLPQAGVNEIYVISGIAISAIIGIIYYIKYKKM